MIFKLRWAETESYLFSIVFLIVNKLHKVCLSQHLTSPSRIFRMCTFTFKKR